MHEEPTKQVPTADKPKPKHARVNEVSRRLGPQAVDGVKDYYTRSEAALKLGTTERKIDELIRAGVLPAIKLGHATTRIPAESFAKLNSAASTCKPKTRASK